MRIDHVGIYVNDVEETKDFYIKYFDATANDGFYNKENGFKSYLIIFESGARLEIMSKPGIPADKNPDDHLGYVHISIGVGSEEAVRAITDLLRDDGFEVVDEPDRSPDGFYESCIRDLNGNLLELTV